LFIINILFLYKKVHTVIPLERVGGKIISN
jgi:hypothetical protein